MRGAPSTEAPLGGGPRPPAPGEGFVQSHAPCTAGAAGPGRGAPGELDPPVSADLLSSGQQLPHLPSEFHALQTQPQRSTRRGPAQLPSGGGRPCVIQSILEPHGQGCFPGGPSTQTREPLVQGRYTFRYCAVCRGPCQDPGRCPQAPLSPTLASSQSRDPTASVTLIFGEALWEELRARPL